MKGCITENEFEKRCVFCAYENKPDYCQAYRRSNDADGVDN